jgi:hypothetical protein
VWKTIVGKGFTQDEFTAYVAGLGNAPDWVEFIVLHNTADPTLAHWHDVSGESRMLNLADYYRNVQHWSAGPHLFVADDLIWVFTPLPLTGVHSPSWNAVSWGVEQAGDFSVEVYNSGAGAKVRDNAVHAVAVLSKWAGLDSASMKLHREDPKTSHVCPGKNVIKSNFIQRVHDRIVSLRAGATR